MLETVIAENTAVLKAILAQLQVNARTSAVGALDVTAPLESTPVEEAQQEAAPAPKAHAARTSSKAKSAAQAEKPAVTEEPADTKPIAEAPVAPEKKAERVSEVSVSYDQAKAAILNLAKARGRAAAQSVLQKLNAKALPDIPSDKFHEVIDACNEALEATEAA